MTAIKSGLSLLMDRCSHCGIAHPNLNLNHQLSTKDKSNSIERLWSIFVCQSCGGVVTISSWSDIPDEIDEIFPSPRILDPSIPLKASEFIRQALDSIHAPAASIMVACSALDEILKQKGLTDGNLYSRIKMAVKKNLITPEMETWANEVRLVANDQRHADESAALPTMDDAKRVLDFVLALAEFLFVLTSRVRKGISDAKTDK